jgi:hypothetical protein
MEFNMTLDGHLKTGLMCSMVWLVYADKIYPGISANIIAITSILILAGNIAPDFLEFKIIPHRTYTHFPWFYVALFAGAYFANITISSTTGTNLLDINYAVPVMAFSLSSIMHIICDWPYYGGIPIFRPTKKVKLFNMKFGGIPNKIFEHSFIVIGVALILIPYLDLNLPTTIENNTQYISDWSKNRD